MKKCAYCKGPIKGKQKTAKYCSDICRLRAYRVRHGIPEPFSVKRNSKPPLNRFLDGQETKSFTCCEDARFYSPAGRWGELLICDNCGTIWKRLDKDPRFKNQDDQERNEND